MEDWTRCDFRIWTIAHHSRCSRRNAVFWGEFDQFPKNVELNNRSTLVGTNNDLKAPALVIALLAIVRLSSSEHARFSVQVSNLRRSRLPLTLRL